MEGKYSHVLSCWRERACIATILFLVLALSMRSVESRSSFSDIFKNRHRRQSLGSPSPLLSFSSLQIAPVVEEAKRASEIVGDWFGHQAANSSSSSFPSPLIAPIDRSISSELDPMNLIAATLGAAFAAVYKRLLEAIRHFNSLGAMSSSYSWLLTQLLDHFDIDLVVKHAVLLSYYIRQLPRFIELNILFLKYHPEKLRDMFDVFDLPYLGGMTGPSFSRQFSSHSGFSTDFSSTGAAWPDRSHESWIHEWLAQIVPRFSARTGSEYAPAHAGITQILDDLLLGSGARWMSLMENFVQSQILTVTARVIEGIPTHVREQFATVKRHVDALFTGDPHSPTGRLLDSDSLSHVVDKMMVDLRSFFTQTSSATTTAEDLPRLDVLLDVLGPFGALCLQTAMTPVARGLIQVTADIVSYFMSLMDTPVEMPIISNIIVAKAHQIFSPHLHGSELLSPSTTLLFWLCILAVIHLKYMGSPSVLHSNRPIDLATSSLPTVEPILTNVWIQDDGELRELVRSAVALERNLTQTTDARFGPRSIFVELSDCERVKMSYWFGAVVATCHLLESRIALPAPFSPPREQHLNGLVNSMLRFPIRFLRLVVSFPMAPRLHSVPYPGPRASFVEQLNRDKVDLYQAQRGAWVFSFAELVYQFIYLPQPGSAGLVPDGPTLGYCLGAMPHLVISIWCHFKRMLILVADSISRSLNSAHIDEGLVAIRDPYQAWTASDLLHAHLPDVIHAPFGQMRRDAALSLLTFFQRHRYGQNESERFDAQLSPITGGFHIPAVLFPRGQPGKGLTASELLILLSNARSLELMAPWPVLNHIKESIALLGPSAFLGIGGLELSSLSVSRRLADMTWGVLFNAADRCIQFQVYDPVLLSPEKARPGSPPLSYFNLSPHLQSLLHGPQLASFPRASLLPPSPAPASTPSLVIPATYVHPLFYSSPTRMDSSLLPPPSPSPPPPSSSPPPPSSSPSPPMFAIFAAPSSLSPQPQPQPELQFQPQSLVYQMAPIEAPSQGSAVDSSDSLSSPNLVMAYSAPLA